MPSYAQATPAYNMSYNPTYQTTYPTTTSYQSYQTTYPSTSYPGTASYNPQTTTYQTTGYQTTSYSHPQSTTTYAQPTYSTGGYTFSQGAGPTIQYTSESSQKYCPPGCQQVSSIPHAIYNPGVVPAFMAPPEVRISPANITNWTAPTVGTQQFQ